MRPEPPEDPKAYRRWLMRRFGLPALFVIALFVVLWMRQGDAATDPWQTALSGPTMGTTWTLKVVTSGKPEVAAVKRLRDAAAHAVAAVNTSMSTYQADSELSRFNASASTEPFGVSAMLLAVLVEAQATTAVTGGAFDVTVGPLVNAWGFGPKKDTPAPTGAELAVLQARVGADKLTVDVSGATVTKARTDVYVDLSAIAKGYGVDQMAAALDRLGYTNYMVEVGGEVRAKGRNKAGETWRIGVEVPVASAQRRVQTIVPLDGRSMATSGDYRNYIERDGKRLSHTIDPRTGRPVEHTAASVTVVSETCMKADALATALNVLGPDAGMALAQAKGWAVLMLVHEGDGFVERKTAAFEALTVPSP
ncbi:MAG: thiamine biosynthesis lipoprotein [Myxococcota bacterium]|jgi:thiamine biosynthesis lipoprotein